MSNTNTESIIRLVSEGKITAEEGAKLIEALSEEQKPKDAPKLAYTSATQLSTAPKTAKGRFLRVIVKVVGDAVKMSDEIKGGEVDIDVNVPLSLARRIVPMLDGVIPSDAQQKMLENGVDLVALVALLETLDEDMEGRDLVNVNIVGDAGKGEQSFVKVRVYVE